MIAIKSVPTSAMGSHNGSQGTAVSEINVNFSRKAGKPH